jgi:two-component system, OmpR family, sensor histidine kinase ChvG
MAPDTDLQKLEPEELALVWSKGLSLTARILAVNLFVLALFAAGLFFLDTYRGRLISERETQAARQVAIITQNFDRVRPEDKKRFLTEFAKTTKSRIRIYDRTGQKIMDTFALAPATYVMRDPAKEPWEKKIARGMDEIFDFLVGAPHLDAYVEPTNDVRSAWPEFTLNISKTITAKTRLAPDFTHFISAAANTTDRSFSVLSTTSARDIRIFVRAERFSVAMFFSLVLGISILLSLFLARTIVRPLRHLAHAAVKVRLGRAQEVTVPRLPSRRDEIGMLARALSDMSNALRQRIDATEAFAADVAHEIKNPLASLRSALDGIDNVADPALKMQLMDVAKADVLRMDRLISDISEASRVDSQLAKAKFELIDIGDMVEQLLQSREHRGSDGDIRVAFARPRKGVAVVLGEDVRLERVLNNLIDNAVSFSPPGGLVEIAATRAEDKILIRVSDEGPGVPEQEREDIFRRFHTERPQDETFGKHSGLGLAIARTIVEGHEGRIRVHDREDGQNGACFEISLPTPESKLN